MATEPHLPSTCAAPAVRHGPLERWLAALLFVGVLTAYVLSPLRVQTDSVWTLPTALSLLREGDAALDEYAPTLARRQEYAIEWVQGRPYSIFPLGPALVAAPLVAGFRLALEVAAPLDALSPALAASRALWRERLDATGLIDPDQLTGVESPIAALLVSGAVLLVFLTARRRVPLAPALAVALLFAFGTSAYSTASRVLWQHSPSLLAIAAVAWLLGLHRRGARASAALGVVVALAYVMRPTNSLSVLAVTGYLALRSRRELPAYLAGAAAVALPFCLYNLSVYGALLPPYFSAGRLTPGQGPFWEALAGQLLSPGRGLFVYTPLALLAVGGFAQRAWRGELQPPEGLYALVLLAHWLVISSFPHWWGGHSYGPRFFTDVLPYLMVLLTPTVAQVFARPRAHRGAAVALALAALLSLFVHVRGATNRRTWAWNDGPPPIDAAPARNWDWRDVAFLRGL